jgi:hypothetical protein
MGGAIYHLNGTLTLSNVAVTNSVAVGDLATSDPTYPGHLGGAFAGAVFSQDGTLNIARSKFINDAAYGANGGVVNALNTDCGDAEGGCINSSSVNSLAYLNISDSVFQGNKAIAGNGGQGSSATAAQGNFFGVVDLAVGGAIMNFYYAFLPGQQPLRGTVAGLASITGTKFINNVAIGGNNAKGGAAYRDIVGVAEGGAISTDASCYTDITNCTLTRNRAIGGNGGTPGTGVSQQIDVGEGAALGVIGNINVYHSTLSRNVAQGGVGGDAYGAAIASILGYGQGTIVNSCIMRNVAMGGAGANGFGGGLYNETGGNAAGGVRGDMMVLQSDMFTQNSAIGSSPGQGIGGGIYNGGNINLLQVKIKRNKASTSNPDTFGV